jgi:hypothetical protein
MKAFFIPRSVPRSIHRLLLVALFAIVSSSLGAAHNDNNNDNNHEANQHARKEGLALKAGKAVFKTITGLGGYVIRHKELLAGFIIASGVVYQTTGISIPSILGSALGKGITHGVSGFFSGLTKGLDCGQELAPVIAKGLFGVTKGTVVLSYKICAELGKVLAHETANLGRYVASQIKR